MEFTSTCLQHGQQLHSTKASIHGCTYTRTTSISLQIINILKIFIFSDRRHNFSSTPGKKFKGSYTEKHIGWGTPSRSDRKSHFMLKITHQIFKVKQYQHKTSYISANNYHLCKIFTFSDRRHNFSSTPEKKLKKGGIQENTEGGGYLLSL